MTRLRLVIDTNVLVSGLLTQNSIPQRVYDYAIAQATLLQSQATLSELERVLIAINRMATLGYCVGEADPLGLRIAWSQPLPTGRNGEFISVMTRKRTMP
jgi:hypothetical protein